MQSFNSQNPWPKGVLDILKNVQNGILKILLEKNNNFSVGKQSKIEKMDFRALCSQHIFLKIFNFLKKLFKAIFFVNCIVNNGTRKSRT